jgi:hypothetical protein
MTLHGICEKDRGEQEYRSLAWHFSHRQVLFPLA